MEAVSRNRECRSQIDRQVRNSKMWCIGLKFSSFKWVTFGMRFAPPQLPERKDKV
jgi:hypothetical protein